MSAHAVRRIPQTTYELQEDDNGARLGFVSQTPVTISVPPNLSLFWCAELLQLGNGILSVAPEQGVIVSNRLGRLRSFGLYARLILEVVSPNVLLLSGDVASVDLTSQDAAPGQ